MARALEVLSKSAVALAFLASCGTTVTTHSLNSGAAGRPPRPAGSVEMFTTAVPARPYVEVAMLEAQQQAYSVDSTEAVFDELRSRAGDMGCDGLVLLGAADATVGGVATTASGTGPALVTGSVRTLHGYRGTCIVWKEAADASRPPPLPADPRCEPACGPGRKCWGGVCAAAQ